jgi:hypothetical protein
VNFFGFMGMEEPRKQELAAIRLSNVDRRKFNQYCEEALGRMEVEVFYGRLTVPDVKFLKSMRIKVFE